MPALIVSSTAGLGWITRRSRHHIVGPVQFGGKPNGDEPAESATNSDDETSF